MVTVFADSASHVAAYGAGLSLFLFAADGSGGDPGDADSPAIAAVLRARRLKGRHR